MAPRLDRLTATGQIADQAGHPSSWFTNIWQRTMAFIEGVLANATPAYALVTSDADFTATRSASVNNILHIGTLTAGRTVTLPASATAGDEVFLTRTGPGAFSLTLAGKALATDTWARAVYSGSIWYLAAYGTL